LNRPGFTGGSESTLCACEFPDSVEIQSPPDTIRVTVVSSVGPIQSTHVAVRAVLETGALDPEVPLEVSGVTGRDGSAILTFTRGFTGTGRFHFVVTGGGQALCKSVNYAIHANVDVHHTTWGRLKADTVDHGHPDAKPMSRGGFSWKRLTGISGAKARVVRRELSS